TRLGDAPVGSSTIAAGAGVGDLLNDTAISGAGRATDGQERTAQADVSVARERTDLLAAGIGGNVIEIKYARAVDSHGGAGWQPIGSIPDSKLASIYDGRSCIGAGG